jgi:very-short-patch-repair endonuclease
MGSQADRDDRRDEWLRDQGLKVLRIRAVDVMKELDSVVAAIVCAVQNLPLHHAPHGSPPQDFVMGRN